MKALVLVPSNFPLIPSQMHPVGFPCHLKFRKIKKHTLSGVLEPSKYILTNNVLNSDYRMDFSNSRAQLNYRQAFMKVPSLKSIQNLYFFLWHLLFLTMINILFLWSLQNNKWETKFSKGFLMGTSKTFGICSSYKFLNTNNLPFVCLKSGSFHFLESYLKISHYLFELTQS